MDGEDASAMAFTTQIGEGTVTTTYASGKKVEQTFNADGTITEVLTTSYGRVTRYKISFGDGIIRKEVIS